MSDYQYEPSLYRSPQRVWDAISGEYLDRWIYEHEFSVKLPDGRVITVEPGFEYDKGSVPRWMQNWLPRDHHYAVIAFLIHDWLYEKQQIEGEWITRKEADRILYDLLRYAGMRWSKAKAAYSGVRLGGWASFNSHAHFIGNTHYIEQSQ